MPCSCFTFTCAISWAVLTKFLFLLRNQLLNEIVSFGSSHHLVPTIVSSFLEISFGRKQNSTLTKTNNITRFITNRSRSLSNFMEDQLLSRTPVGILISSFTAKLKYEEKYAMHYLIFDLIMCYRRQLVIIRCARG